MGRTSKIYITFSFIIAAAAAIACTVLAQKAKTNHFVDVALGAVALYAVLGFLQLYICNDCLDDFHYNATMIMPYLTLPFLATEMWMKYNPHKYAFIHLGVGILMAIVRLMCEIDDNARTFVMVANTASIAYVCATKQAYYGPAAAIFFLVLDYICMKCGVLRREKLFNVGLAGFSALTLMSVK